MESNLSTVNLKLFCNLGRIYRFRKKFKKNPGEINPLGVHRNMRGCIGALVLKWGYMHLIIRSLLNSFELPSYSSKSRKRYILEVLCC